VKRLVVLTIVAMLIASSAGCQSGRFLPWQNAAVRTTPSATNNQAVVPSPTDSYGAVPGALSARYARAVMPPPTYSYGSMFPSIVAPSGGCGSGCCSCGGN
jgi:hypothetical protein